ncbi:hypothetical protein B0I08_104131 [Glaciihabitans tibetensis]|uniref:Uncharacterized protein n=1 Tax=Glaciihabitans tibetensis TaxID=1266600 RepID=A0A2T0VE24_9MICO|nr:hypothetical protein [Glaciihabitans tibetensis]PRY68429.1 hypothetical protein B0I08_104131 [Glaciihabitans tibetensis]
MSEPLMPHVDNDESASAAAEPGPGAPGTPAAGEPDILPGAESADDEQSLNEKAKEPDAARGAKETPFRTPNPGDSLTADELEDRI